MKFRHSSSDSENWEEGGSEKKNYKSVMKRRGRWVGDCTTIVPWGVGVVLCQSKVKRSGSGVSFLGCVLFTTS